MSSSLSVITCDGPLPQDLSPHDMALWSINNVYSAEFGSHSYCDKKYSKQGIVYLHPADLLAFSCVNNEFIEAVSTLIKEDKTTDKVVVIPTSTMQKIWIDDVTLAIKHESKGYLNAIQWFNFCTVTEFLVYKNVRIGD